MERLPLVSEKQGYLTRCFPWISWLSWAGIRGWSQRFSQWNNYRSIFDSNELGSQNKFEHCLRQNGTNWSSNIARPCPLLIADFLICWCSSSRTPSINRKKQRNDYSTLEGARYVSFELWAQGKILFILSTGSIFDDEHCFQGNGIQTRFKKFLTAYCTIIGKTFLIMWFNSLAKKVS